VDRKSLNLWGAEEVPVDRPVDRHGSLMSMIVTRSAGLDLLLTTTLVGLAYYVAAHFGLKLALVHNQVTPIWPPTGIAVAAMLMFGRRIWPGVALGAFAVNAPLGPSILGAATIAAGNTLAPVLAVTLLRRVGFQPDLRRLQDAIAIVVLGALVAMSVSATIGATTLLVSRSIPGSEFWPSWWVWWTGDAMGVLVVTPFLLSLRSIRFELRGTWSRRLEAAVLFVCLVAVANVAFHSPLQIEYLVFPFLAWAAWRFGQRGAAPAALVTSAIAVWAAVKGTGPFADGTLWARMATLQVFNASVTFATFFLAALVSERGQDILGRLRAEDALTHMALHDPLTGLANRSMFTERLTQALARTERHAGAVGVLFLDLDRFKVINDSLGHEAGDRVLEAVADRLRSVLRPEDTASRFGGDEFVILCEDLVDELEAVTIAERIGAAITEPIALQTGEIVITTSIGISLSKGLADRPEELIRDADAAVYRAKERGRARFELFDHDMRLRAIRRLETENDLRRALDAGELRVYYQPMVRLDSQAVEGMEALVRWEHPQRGLLAPASFIPVAEETGLIADLGEWVLREACRQSVKWDRRVGRRGPVTIAVNLSARQLARPEFEDTLRRILEETGAEPTNLALEITETMLVDAAGPTLATLQRLRELGVHLSIDDFGTGYSSLTYLKQFQVDSLKVDRSFVKGLGRDREDSSIVTAVVNLAHGLGLTAVAEGVETESQREQLYDLGCDFGQGFHFSPPRPADALDLVVLHDAGLANA
jgi:diguanylate cyclase (GGDEF)-like protein